jgi:hypothetical protein
LILYINVLFFLSSFICFCWVIIIIIDHTRFNVDFSRFMREHLCKICMREKSLKRRKISLYASFERSHWASYSTYYVFILLYLWLLFLLSWLKKIIRDISKLKKIALINSFSSIISLLLWDL